MDFILEFILEFVMEVFVEVYISLFYVFFPEKKVREKHRKHLRYFAIFTVLLMFVSFVAGCVILVETEGKSKWGFILLLIPVAYLFVGLILYVRRKKKNNKDGK